MIIFIIIKCHNLQKKITDKGGIIVASAGNKGIKVKYTEHKNEIIIPCELDDVICVGGIDKDLAKKGDIRFYENKNPEYGSFNYGSGIDLYAPYVTHYYIEDGMYYDKGINYGTSFSTPLVAGLISTILSEFPEKKYKKDDIY